MIHLLLSCYDNYRRNCNVLLHDLAAAEDFLDHAFDVKECPWDDKSRILFTHRDGTQWSAAYVLKD